MNEPPAQPVFNTARLILRPLAESDADWLEALHRLVDHPAAGQRLAAAGINGQILRSGKSALVGIEGERAAITVGDANCRQR